MGNIMPPLPRAPESVRKEFYEKNQPESVTRGCLGALCVMALIAGASIGFVAFLFANGATISNWMDQWFANLVNWMRIQ